MPRRHMRVEVQHSLTLSVNRGERSASHFVYFTPFTKFMEGSAGNSQFGRL